MDSNNIKTIRQSNFELLRILAIIMIIIHHIFVHVVIPQLRDPSLYGLGEMFNNAVFYKKLFFGDLASAFGNIANNLFIMISGYFLVSYDELHIGKNIVKVVSQLVYVSFIIVITSFIYLNFINSSFLGAQNISIINNEFWFVGYYLLIIIIGKYFLNKRLDKLDNREYLTVVLSGFVISSLVFSRVLLSNINENVAILFNGLFVYSLGGYIKKYNPFGKLKTIMILLMMVIIVGIMYISYYNYSIENINNLNSIQTVCYQIINGYSNSSIVCIVLSICIFELFNRIKIGTNKIINFIAKSSMIIYVLHDNNFFRKIWYSFDWIKPYHDNIGYFFLLVLLNVLTVIVIGILLYILYVLLKKTINSSFGKKIMFKE